MQKLYFLLPQNRIDYFTQNIQSINISRYIYFYLKAFGFSARIIIIAYNIYI